MLNNLICKDASLEMPENDRSASVLRWLDPRELTPLQGDFEPIQNSRPFHLLCVSTYVQWAKPECPVSRTTGFRGSHSPSWLSASGRTGG